MIITFTPKGKQNKAYEISQSKMFSQHRTDIYEAVRQGCPHDIEELKSALADPELWAQEYEIKFLDEATAFVTYDLINEAESDLAGKPELAGAGPFYAGMDIGRRRDLTVIWVLEKSGDVLWTREVVELSRATFAAQADELDRVMRRYKPARVCVDRTGMGEKPVEDAQGKYGALRVEGVSFTQAVKLDLANGIIKKMQDRLLRIPHSRAIRDDLHGVKKVVTSSGNVRFDAERTGDGHADRFWALALALHAGSAPAPETRYESVSRRSCRRAAGAF